MINYNSLSFWTHPYLHWFVLINAQVARPFYAYFSLICFFSLSSYSFFFSVEMLCSVQEKILLFITSKSCVRFLYLFTWNKVWSLIDLIIHLKTPMAKFFSFKAFCLLWIQGFIYQLFKFIRIERIAYKLMKATYMHFIIIPDRVDAFKTCRGDTLIHFIG